ncbi:MAG: 4Fe-4S binding protein [Elusimicrobiota bacterium]
MKNKYLKLRRLSQAVFFVLFAVFLWRAMYPFQEVAGAKIFFAIDPLTSMMVALSERVLVPILIPSFIILGITAILGRVFCGWLCPMGTMIDMAGFFRDKFLSRKKELESPGLRFIKFAVLFIAAAFALRGIQLAWWGDPITIAGRFLTMSFIPFLANGIESLFRIVIEFTGYPEGLLSAYRWVNNFIGGLRTNYFPNTVGIVMLWSGLIFVSAFSRRFWCRNLCPLGALLALFSKWAPFKRSVSVECIDCKKCISDCRMGAINKDYSYKKEECILCMDCVYDCKNNATEFSFITKNPQKNGEIDSGRRNFLKMAGSLTLVAILPGCKDRNKTGSDISPYVEGLLRPPGALEEQKFIDRCIRCGNCMRGCPTNGLQPVIVDGGVRSVWTPKLVPETGHCEYNCNLCGKLCPTGAIPFKELSEKQNIIMGKAEILRDRCIPWSEDAQCLVCEEHCPVSDKAIKLNRKKVVNGVEILRPVVETDLCIGCGTCLNVCPATPKKAISIDAKEAERG